MTEEIKIKNNVTLVTKILYGLGGMFCYTLAGRFGLYYKLFFLTNIAGFPTDKAAVIYSSATVVGIVATLVSGVIIDTTNLKWGKYRSWIMIGLTGAFFLSWLSFLKIDTTNYGLYGVYIIVIGALQTFFYQLNWCAYRSLVGPMSVTTEDQVGLSTASSLGMQAAGFVAGPVLLALMNFWLGTGMEQAYMMIQFSLSCLYIVSFFILSNLAKKYEKVIGKTDTSSDVKAKKEKTGLLDIVKNIKGPMIPYFFANIITNTYSGFFSALLAYYTVYYLNDSGATAISQTAYSCGSIIGALLTPKICAKFGMKRTYVTSLFICAGSFLPLLFIPPVSMVFYLVRALNGLFQAPSGTAMVAMANDIADNAELHGEKGARAFTQSILGASINIGFVLSATISSFALAAIGYVSGEAVTPEIIKGIMKLITFGPMCATLGGAVIMLFYRIDEKALTEYRAARNALK